MDIFFDNIFLFLIISIVPAFVLDFTHTPKLIYAKEFNWAVVKWPLFFIFLGFLPSGIVFGLLFSQSTFEQLGVAVAILVVSIISFGWSILGTLGAMLRIYFRYLAEQEKNKKKPDHTI